jgi:hypothetical protein
MLSDDIALKLLPMDSLNIEQIEEHCVLSGATLSAFRHVDIHFREITDPGHDEGQTVNES